MTSCLADPPVIGRAGKVLERLGIRKEARLARSIDVESVHAAVPYEGSFVRVVLQSRRIGVAVGILAVCDAVGVGLVQAHPKVVQGGVFACDETKSWKKVPFHKPLSIRVRE